MCEAQTEIDKNLNLCSKRSTGEIDNLKMSDSIYKRVTRANEWFLPPDGEGYVSPDRKEKGHEARAEYKIYCQEHCNAYELFSMHLGFGQTYYEEKRYQEMFQEYSKALETKIKIPIGFETDIMLNMSKVYFEQEKYANIEQCLLRLHELDTLSLIDDGYLIAAAKISNKRHEEALVFIDSVIKEREQSNYGLAMKNEYKIKIAILEYLKMPIDIKVVDNYKKSVEIESMPKVYDFSYPKIPRAVTKGKVKGECILVFDVLANGKTDNIRMQSCDHESLIKPSISALEKTIYRPRIVNDAPVKTEGLNKKFIYGREG